MIELSTLFAGIPHRVLYPRVGLPPISIRKIAIDSRAVEPGDLFVAIPGQKADGHHFLMEAAGRGAAAVVVDRPMLVAGVVSIQVASTLETLGKLAATYHGHPAQSMTLYGVTGTNGKTTTTFLLESILTNAGLSTGLLGTILYKYAGHTQSAPLTTPGALEFHAWMGRMRDHGTQAVAMEVSSHALALARLEDVLFDVVGFTNLSQDHLDFHRDMESYYQAKKLLFQKHRKPDATSVVCIDSPAGVRLAQELAGSPVLTVSSKTDPDPSFGENQPDIFPMQLHGSMDGFTAVFHTPKGSLPIRCLLPGDHNVANVAVAIGMALGGNVPRHAIQLGIASMSAVPGRMERVALHDASGPCVFVDYAHSPDAMLRVLETTRRWMQKDDKHHLVVVFGCGGERDRAKRPAMGKVAAAYADKVILTTDNPRTENPTMILQEISAGIPKQNTNVLVEPDRAKAIHMAIGSCSTEDVVLVLGKGHEQYQLIGKTSIPFDDKAVAQEALRQRKQGAHR